MLILVDFLGVRSFFGVGLLFCNVGGTVGMASTVLVVGPLGTGASLRTSGTVELEFSFTAQCLVLIKLLFPL